MNFFKKVFCKIFIGLSMFGTSLFAAPGLSPEEKMFYDQINSMNEEEQLQLWNAIVDEVQKEANKLPEGEREKFLESFWGEVNQQAIELEQKIQAEEQNNAPQAPAIEAPIVKAPEQPIEKPIVNTKIDKAIQLIDELIRGLENVLRKANIIPDINGKVQDWTNKGALKGLQNAKGWNGARADLEKMIAKMKQLKDKDIKTNKYKYIEALSKNENLVNNMSQMNAVLSSFESKIEIPEFGSQTLSDSSKNALQKVLTSIFEALYHLRMPAMIDEIIASYDQRAQTLKTEQEAAVKAAQSAQPRMRETKATVAGTAPTVGTYDKRATGKDSYFDTFFNTPSTSPSARGTAGRDSMSPFDTGAGKADQGGKGSSAGGNMSAGSGAGSKPVDMKGDKKPSDFSKGDKKDDKPKDGDKKDAKDKKEDEDKLVRGHLDKLTLQLDELHGLLEERPLASMENYLTSTAPLNKQFAKTVLPNTIEKTKSAAASARNIARAFRSRVKTPEQQKTFRAEINELTKEHAGIINTILNQLRNLKAKEDSVSADKQYAFMGGQTTPDTIGLLTDIANPASIYELEERLRELLAAMNEIR